MALLSHIRSRGAPIHFSHTPECDDTDNRTIEEQRIRQVNDDFFYWLKRVEGPENLRFPLLRILGLMVQQAGESRLEKESGSPVHFSVVTCGPR